MRSVFTIIIFGVTALCHGCFVGGFSEFVKEETEFVSLGLKVDFSRVLKRVNKRFLSVSIDASLVAEEKFMYLLG